MPRPTKNGSTFRSVQDVHAPKPYKTECCDKSFVLVPGVAGLENTPVPCQKCRHCLWSKSQSVANSVEMEMQDSEWAIWLTLTIAPNSKAAKDGFDKKIDKSLMQGFHYRCNTNRYRKKHSFEGRNCTGWRYIQCGEYGGKKGRAHYHAVIFGKGDKPKFADKAAERVWAPEWPHGHMNVSLDVDGGVAFYLSKYMGKRGPGNWHSASNRYAIGGRFIVRHGAALALRGCMVPTLDWKFTYGDMFAYRKALVRGSKQRDWVLSFCETVGRSVLSLATLMPKVTHLALVRIERWKRERAYKAEHGICGFFARERIKKAVFSDIRAILGIVETDDLRAGRPPKPVGWTPDYGKHRKELLYGAAA